MGWKIFVERFDTDLGFYESWEIFRKCLPLKNPGPSPDCEWANNFYCNLINAKFFLLDTIVIAAASIETENNKFI